jgi:RNA polymerase sigma factor (sigma-70 family)
LDKRDHRSIVTSTESKQSSQLSLDASLVFVAPIARHLVHQFVRRFTFLANEREDIESELLLKFCKCFAHFDLDRASLRTFASRIMRNELFSFLRHRLARRRNSMTTTTLNRGENLPEGVPGIPNRIVRQEFQMDIERAVSSWPSLHDLKEGLYSNSVTELSRLTGESRRSIYKKIAQLRVLAVAAHIREDYFGAWKDQG